MCTQFNFSTAEQSLIFALCGRLVLWFLYLLCITGTSHIVSQMRLLDYYFIFLTYCQLRVLPGALLGSYMYVLPLLSSFPTSTTYTYISVVCWLTFYSYSRVEIPSLLFFRCSKFAMLAAINFSDGIQLYSPWSQIQYQICLLSSNILFLSLLPSYKKGGSADVIKMYAHLLIELDTIDCSIKQDFFCHFAYVIGYAYLLYLDFVSMLSVKFSLPNVNQKRIDVMYGLHDAVSD